MTLPLSLGEPGAPLKLLCLGAHCDDIEIGCGGTLLRLLSGRPGSQVRRVVFASDPDRERGTRASATDFLASAGRADVAVKQFRESYFPWAGAAIKDEFERLKGKGEETPDIVFTHYRRDEHHGPPCRSRADLEHLPESSDRRVRDPEVRGRPRHAEPLRGATCLDRAAED